MLAQPLFLLLLVFLPTSRGCRDASKAECDKAHFVPGHSLVGEGFNVLTMRTTGALVVDMKTYMNGNKCTLCYNSLLRKNQKVPVSVVDWRIKVSCKRSLSGRMFESSTSVLRENSQSSSTSWNVGLGVENKGSVAVGGTHSRSSTFALQHGRKDKYSYSTQEFSCKYYTFRVNSQPALSKYFEAALKRLPNTKNPNHRAYTQFFNTYGTHFIRKVDLGGRVRSITALRTCEMTMKGMKASDVSNCLSVEASGTVKGVTLSASVEHCKAQSKKFGYAASFSAMFRDRFTEVLGGYNKVSDILFNTASNYDVWLDSVKSVPGVVSYQLTPIHMLVRNNPTLKSQLHEAIKAYIKRSAVPLTCTNKCTQGRPDSNCMCKCSGNGGTAGNCCPRKPGGAKITLIVNSAQWLDADIFNGADTYVKARYGNKRFHSRVIDNDDSPRFNYHYVWPDADLTSRKYLFVQLWDEDDDEDDLLGDYKITIPSAMARPEEKTYRLTDGRLYMTVLVECHPNLTGPLCNRLLPMPESSSRASWGMALATSALPEGTLTTHNDKFL